MLLVIEIVLSCNKSLSQNIQALYELHQLHRVGCAQPCFPKENDPERHVAHFCYDLVLAPSCRDVVHCARYHAHLADLHLAPKLPFACNC